MTRVTLLAAAALALVLAGCGSGRVADGEDYTWPANMANQASVSTLASVRPAPAGSVPVGGVEHLEDRTDDEDLKDPFPKDAAATTRGHTLFEIHCAICHGTLGHGHGRIAKSFPPAPDLRYATICRRSDGFIYGTITAGGRAMPVLRAGLSSRDRWDLVAFVRKIQSQGCTSPGGTTPAPAGATTGGK